VNFHFRENNVCLFNQFDGLFQCDLESNVIDSDLHISPYPDWVLYARQDVPVYIFSINGFSSRLVCNDLSSLSMYCNFGEIINNLCHFHSFSVDELFYPTFRRVCTDPPVAHVAANYSTFSTLACTVQLFSYFRTHF
jgi:hypothetical protein